MEKQLDMFRPALAKFKVKCFPSRTLMFTRAASFKGAERAARAHQFGDKKDKIFEAVFWMWENDPNREDLPPIDFVWPMF